MGWPFSSHDFLSWHFAVWFGGRKQSAWCAGWAAETCLAAIHPSLILVYTLDNLSLVLSGLDYT